MREVRSSGDDEAAAAAAQTRWGALLLVGAILGITQLGYYLTAAALPLYLRDLGAPQDRIGLEVGLGNMVGVAATFLLGPALNRYGAQLFLRLAAVLYLLAGLGMLLLDHELPVAALRTLQGIGTAVLLPSSMTLAARLGPGRQATALGAMGALNALALAAGPPIGLALYGDGGARALFLPAVAAAALGLLSVAFLPRVPATRETPSGFGFDRRWTPLVLANGLAAFYFGGIIAYLPLYLRSVHGPNAGIFFTADAVGVLLLRIPTGLLVDRRGSTIPMLLGLAITLPGIAVLAAPPSLPTLVLAGAMTGIGAGLFITGVYADLAARSTDANRGTALSMSSASFGGAIFAGGAVSGLLIGPGGFNAVLLLGGVTCAAALPLALLGERASPG